MNQAAASKEKLDKTAKKAAKLLRRQQLREDSALNHTPVHSRSYGGSAHQSTSTPHVKSASVKAKKDKSATTGFFDSLSIATPHMAASARERNRAEFTIPKGILDDICARFPLSIEHESVSDDEALHLLFVVEECHWFYIDYSCRDKALQPIEFEPFARQVFERYGKLARFVPNFGSLHRAWLNYKRKIPVHGAILMDAGLEWLVLVRQIGARSWFFPKGKINEGESAGDCAVREVLEECGYDCSALLDPAEYVFIGSPHAQGAVLFEDESNGNVDRSRLFLVVGVPRDTPLATRTRNEIGKIEWFRIDDLRHAAQTGQSDSEFFRVNQLLPQIEQFVLRKRNLLASQGAVRAKATWSNGTSAQAAQDVTLNKYEQMELENYTFLFQETMGQERGRPATLPSPDEVRLAMLRNKAALLTADVKMAAGAAAQSQNVPIEQSGPGHSVVQLHFDNFVAPSWRSPILDTKCISDAFKAAR